jgi:hypothetical protein
MVVPLAISVSARAISLVGQVTQRQALVHAPLLLPASPIDPAKDGLDAEQRNYTPDRAAAVRQVLGEGSMPATTTANLYRPPSPSPVADLIRRHRELMRIIFDHHRAEVAASFSSRELPKRTIKRTA